MYDYALHHCVSNQGYTILNIAVLYVKRGGSVGCSAGRLVWAGVIGYPLSLFFLCRICFNFRGLPVFAIFALLFSWFGM